MLAISTVSAALMLTPVAIDITEFGASPEPGDDTKAIQAAFDKAKATPGSIVRIPAGTFEANQVTMWANTTLEGVGPASVIRTVAGAYGGMITVNPVTTPDAKTRLAEKNVVIRNLTVRGNCDTEGFKEHTDLIRFFGVEDALVSKVRFIGFKGDGLYIGDGVADKGVIRHNRNVVVEDCEFDGINKKNRNGITLGDGENVTIRRNKFTRVTDVRMPGCIDIEQNKNDYHIAVNIQVLDNEFFDNGGTAIMMDVAKPQRELKVPVKNILVKGNRIRKQQRRGIMLNQFSEFDPKAAQAGARIEDNEISEVPIPIAIEGVQGVSITGNKITNTDRGMLIGFGKIGRGTQNITIKRNTFDGVGFDPTMGGAALVILNALHVTFEENTIRNLKGKQNALVLFVGASGGSRAGYITARNNTVDDKNLTPYRTRSVVDLAVDTLNIRAND